MKHVAKKVVNLTNVLLFMILIMGFIISTMMYGYVKLHTAHPLENLRGAFIEPVYEGQHALEVEGVFDRHIQCNLIKFKLEFLNIHTHESIYVGPAHLLKTPPPNTGPGKDIPLAFSVLMPKSMYQGTWRPTFHGDYICKYGMFMSNKHVDVTVSPFTVKERSQ